MENKTLITPEWLKRNGWVEVGPDTWTRVINDVWYNIIHTDMDNTYILTKSVGTVSCAENLIELDEHYQRDIEYHKQKLIDKACEYIRTHVWETVDADEDPIIESVHNTTKEGFIKDFKRYMDN